tara:strand:- start:662 stop:970 length:309 start_codon:yes stop_codon:yes gene_type:complete
MNDKNKLTSLDDLVNKFNTHNKKFINDLEKEESIQPIESIESIKNSIITSKNSTELKKQNFINEINGGLGAKIKTNPNEVKIIKKSLLERVKITLRKIFKKF